MKATPTNIYSMAAWINEGQPARVHSTSLRHIRRCMKAGLIGADLSVTEAGLEALREQSGHKTCAAALDRLSK